jgi:hypothetical protein
MPSLFSEGLAVQSFPGCFIFISFCPGKLFFVIRYIFCSKRKSIDIVYGIPKIEIAYFITQLVIAVGDGGIELTDAYECTTKIVSRESVRNNRFDIFMIQPFPIYGKGVVGSQASAAYVLA